MTKNINESHHLIIIYSIFLSLIPGHTDRWCLMLFSFFLFSRLGAFRLSFLVLCHWLGNSNRLASVDQGLVAETFPHITFFDPVRDIGIILDQELSFSLDINLLTRSCYYQLCYLRTVSRSMFHD